MQEYPCHAYHEELPKGKASGKAVVDSGGIQFVINGKTHRMSYSGMQLEIGGASDRIVFFRHPQLRDWTFYTSDRSILSNDHIKQHPQLMQQVKTVRTKRQKHFLAIAAIVAVVIATPIFLLTRMDWVTAKVATQVPVEWEEKLGESTIDQYSLSHELLEQEQAEELLQPLVQPLLDQLSDSRYSYNFNIALDPSLNAFAVPGGYVVIHSQLILEADNAEELLGVLAHELTHVEEQHGVRNVIGALGLYAIVGALFGDVGGLAATIVNAAPFLLNQSYSRGFERESDKKGFELLVQANINPRGLGSFFEKLIAKEKEQLEKIEDEQTRGAIEQAMRFLSTHPASSERVSYLEKLSSDVPEQGFRNLDAEFAALQEAVRVFVTDFEDEQPEQEVSEQEQLEEGALNEN